MMIESDLLARREVGGNSRFLRRCGLGAMHARCLFPTRFKYTRIYGILVNQVKYHDEAGGMLLLSSSQFFFPWMQTK